MSRLVWIEAAVQGMLAGSLSSTAFAVSDPVSLVREINAAGVHWGSGVFLLSHGDGRVSFWGAGDDLVVFPVQRARGGLRLLQVRGRNPRAWIDSGDVQAPPEPLREDEEPANCLAVYRLLAAHLLPQQCMSLYGRQLEGRDLILSKWEVGAGVCRGHRFKAFGELKDSPVGAVDSIVGTQGTWADCMSAFNDLAPLEGEARVLDFVSRRAGAA